MMKNFKVLLFFPNEPLVGVTPSNLALLSACLKKEDFQVKLFDCSLYRRYNEEETKETQDDLRTKLGQAKKSPIDEYIQVINEDPREAFLRIVEEWKPDLIGITLVDSTIRFSYNFIEKIKHLKIPIVAGGVGSTFMFDKILKSGYVDYVCMGEGEEAIVELADKLDKGEDCSEIQNLCLMKDGKIKKNSMRSLVDLEKLPMPDFSIYDDARFYRPFMGRVVRMAQIDFDRGCPYSCTYCAAPSLAKTFKEEGAGQYYRVKSLDTIFKEMKYLIKKYKLDFLYLSSETLLIIKMEKFEELARRYIEEINLPFWCQTRLDSFSEEKSVLLKKMGCQSVSVGLEHGSEELRRKLLLKRIPNEKIFDAFKVMAKYDILPTINSMLGLPDETRENVFETIEMNRKISKILKGKHNINVFTFIPFSGTSLRAQSIQKGYIDPDAEIPFSFYKESMLTMPSMSKKEIQGLEKCAPLYISLPKKYFREIKIAENDDEMFNNLVQIMNDRKNKKLRGKVIESYSNTSKASVAANPYFESSKEFKG